MEKEKTDLMLDVCIYSRETEDFPANPTACIEISKYGNYGGTVTWLHSMAIAETDESGNLFRYKSTEDFRNLFGGLYYDYVKAMDGLGIKVEDD